MKQLSSSTYRRYMAELDPRHLAWVSKGAAAIKAAAIRQDEAMYLGTDKMFVKSLAEKLAKEFDLGSSQAQDVLKKTLCIHFGAACHIEAVRWLLGTYCYQASEEIEFILWTTQGGQTKALDLF